MKNIVLLFEQFSSNEELKKWAYEYVENNHEGFNSIEDAIEELDCFFDNEYSDLIGNNVKLYRVLEVEDESDIDIDNLGMHYLHPAYLQRIYDEEFYNSIGLSVNSDDYFYLVACETSDYNIDFKDTIRNRLAFPREFEVTLLDSVNINILSVKKIDKNLIK